MHKVSIITPSHNPKFLKELEATIYAQKYTNWEWIVLLNNGAAFTPSKADERVKIIECPFNSDSVGFLKRLACMQATGEVIAEVDHDDMITPDCTGKIAQAFEDENIGFVFSQNAKLSKDFRPYMSDYGWTHKTYRYKNQSLYAMYNQPVYPGRLGHIWFAPDHIRAWRREVYEKIGGHDDSLKVCDDLDLMHRLYMVTKFKEIQEVLYIYRITGDNTYQAKGAEIREANIKLYDNNILNLSKRYCEINKLQIIDLAVNTWDDQLLGCRDNAAGLVIANDVLQFVADPQWLMGEIHRVLSPGGLLLSATPSTDGRGAFQDPRHLSFWNENSFWYYTKEAYAKKIRNTKLFRQCRMVTSYADAFNKDHKIAYVHAHLEKI